MLQCWENQGKIKYTGHDSQIGKGWEKLKYPFTDYRILKYLDILSQVELARDDPRIAAMMDVLVGRGDEKGRFTAESIHKVWSDFDFGQKKAPSRWVTFFSLSDCQASGGKMSATETASVRPCLEPVRLQVVPALDEMLQWTASSIIRARGLGKVPDE